MTASRGSLADDAATVPLSCCRIHVDTAACGTHSSSALVLSPAGCAVCRVFVANSMDMERLSLQLHSFLHAGVVVADCSPVSEDSEYPGIADCPCSDVRFCDKTGSSTYMRNIHKDAILTGYVHQPRAPKGHKLAVCTTRRSLVQQLEQAMQDAKDVDIVLFWEVRV